MRQQVPVNTSSENGATSMQIGCSDFWLAACLHADQRAHLCGTVVATHHIQSAACKYLAHGGECLRRPRTAATRICNPFAAATCWTGDRHSSHVHFPLFLQHACTIRLDHAYACSTCCSLTSLQGVAQVLRLCFLETAPADQYTCTPYARSASRGGQRWAPDSSHLHPERHCRHHCFIDFLFRSFTGSFRLRVWSRSSARCVLRTSSRHLGRSQRARSSVVGCHACVECGLLAHKQED